jgi:glycosyltransferase involved in cell wall biosynthesis
VRLSVIIPVYNEKDYLAQVLDRVHAVPLEKEVIVVDDASTDGTQGLYPFLMDRIDHLILHRSNRGKGAAIRTGLAKATGDYVLFQDADLEYDPRDLLVLLEPVHTHDAAVVYGSRFLSPSPWRSCLSLHWLANKALTFLSNLLARQKLTDMETCYKLFRRDVIQGIQLKENGFGFEPEITAKIGRARLPIYEVAVRYAGRTVAQGKKIGWRDGVRSLWCIVKYNLLT